MQNTSRCPCDCRTLPLSSAQVLDIAVHRRYMADLDIALEYRITSSLVRHIRRIMGPDGRVRVDEVA